MPKNLLNDITFARFSISALLSAILLEGTSELAGDIASHETRMKTRYAYVTTIVSAYATLVTLKFRQHQTNIFNATTFYHKKLIHEIDPAKLIILDQCAFDVDELASYANSNLADIYRNPHKKCEFTSAAKALIKKNSQLKNFALSLEKRLASQKKYISDDLLDNLIIMLEKINQFAGDDETILNQLAPVVAEEEVEVKSDEDEEAEEVEEAELESELVSNVTPLVINGDRNEANEEMVAEEIDQVHDIFEDRNLPSACDEAHLEFVSYLDSLNKRRKKLVEDYLIEVANIDGGVTRFKFREALAGGNNIHPCVITMQIFLWQMVVTFRPAMIAKVPLDIKDAAERARMEIRSSNYKTTIMGDVLQFTTTYGMRFFDAVSLAKPIMEDDKPRQARFFSR